MILKIILSVLCLIFFILWRGTVKLSKYYRKQWAYFEGEYYKVYGAWIKKLTPEELMRVQQHSIDRDKKDYELGEPLKKSI
jgi:hypothetical protein